MNDTHGDDIGALARTYGPAVLDEDVERAQASAFMRAAFARLKPRDAECFVLRHLHGLAPATIGAAIGISENHVSVSVRSSHMAVVSPLDHAVEEDDALKWLKDIREFQGVATRPEPREIDGKQAYGWRFQAAAVDMVLWATEDGLPLQMTVNPSAQLQLDFHFEFDVPIAPESFSTEIPAGYITWEHRRRPRPTREWRLIGQTVSGERP